MRLPKKIVRLPIGLLAALLALILSTAPSQAQFQLPASVKDLFQGVELLNFETPRIDFAQKRLKNGLRVIVHRDPTTPMVAVNVTYMVGSTDERTDELGMAHIFEHLMFAGSQHFQGEYISLMESIGATRVNGSTSKDLTSYYQTVPKEALDLTLWMESERMAYLMGQMNHAKLKRQLTVVKNEARQHGAQPYLRAINYLEFLAYGEDHPYARPSIGYPSQMQVAEAADVNHASNTLNIAKIAAWHQKWHQPKNAVLVLSGDIDPQQGLQLAERYFGAIPATMPSNASTPRWQRQPRPSKARVIGLTDTILHPRQYLGAAGPQAGTPEAIHLALLCALINHPASVLQQQLVLEKHRTHFVNCNYKDRRVGGLLTLVTEAADADRLKKAVAFIRREISLMARGKIDRNLLNIVKSQLISQALQALQTVGGKADLLAINAAMVQDPNFWQKELAWLQDATAKQVSQVVERWLSHRWAMVQVTPGEPMAMLPRTWLKTDTSDGEAPKDGRDAFDNTARMANEGQPATNDGRQGQGWQDPIDRQQLPNVPPPNYANLQDYSQSRLCGPQSPRILTAYLQQEPMVSMAIFLPYGHAFDPRQKSGLAALSMQLLTHKTQRLNHSQLAMVTDAMGANLGYRIESDATWLMLTAPKSAIVPSFRLLMQILTKPQLDGVHFDEQKFKLLAEIQRESAHPNGLLLQNFSQGLYGSSHPYGYSLTGRGASRNIHKMTLSDVKEWHRLVLQRPEKLTVVVSGDVTHSQVREISHEAMLDYVDCSSLEPLEPALEPGLNATLEPTNQDLRQLALLAGAAPAASEPQGVQVSTLPVRAPRQRRVDLPLPSARQATLAIGHVLPIDAAATPRRQVAMTLANAILGGTFSSRLNLLMREDKGWVYGARSIILPRWGQRSLMIYLTVNPKHLDQSITAIGELIAGLRNDNPISAQEMNLHRNRLLRELAVGFETSNAVTQQALDRMKVGIHPNRLKDWILALQEVTVEEVNDWIWSNLSEELLVVTVAPPAPPEQPNKPAALDSEQSAP